MENEQAKNGEGQGPNRKFEKLIEQYLPSMKEKAYTSIRVKTKGHKQLPMYP